MPILALLLSAFLLVPSAEAAPKAAPKPAPKKATTKAKTPELIEGCQGEGCGCTHDNRTDKPLTLYKARSTRSKVLGKFTTGTSAKLLKVATLVLRPGKARVKAVLAEDSGLKAGEELTHLFAQGEGLWEARRNGKKISYQEGDAELEILQPAKYEVWVEVSVGAKHGFTDVFPFQGCLE